MGDCARGRRRHAVRVAQASAPARAGARARPAELRRRGARRPRRARGRDERAGRPLPRLGARRGRFTSLRARSTRRGCRGRGGGPRRRADPVAGGRRPRDRSLAGRRRAGRGGHVRPHQAAPRPAREGSLEPDPGRGRPHPRRRPRSVRRSRTSRRRRFRRSNPLELTAVELARPLDPPPADKPSVLAGLRLQRKLTVEEGARRAALCRDQVEWLEEARLYRFPNSEAAVLALLRYATSLGIDHREARRLAGLPVEPPANRPFARWFATIAAAVLVGVLVTAFFVGFGHGGSTQASKAAAALP